MKSKSETLVSHSVDRISTPVKADSQATKTEAEALRQRRAQIAAYI